MKRLTMTIATVMAMIALLSEYSHAMASNYHKRHGGGDNSGYSVGPDAGPDAPAPVSVPEPGSFVLLATGFGTLGGFLAGRWYLKKKQPKQPERPEL